MQIWLFGCILTTNHIICSFVECHLMQLVKFFLQSSFETQLKIAVTFFLFFVLPSFLSFCQFRLYLILSFCLSVFLSFWYLMVLDKFIKRLSRDWTGLGWMFIIGKRSFKSTVGAKKDCCRAHSNLSQTFGGDDSI